jgi:hypothetical protein
MEVSKKYFFIIPYVDAAKRVGSRKYQRFEKALNYL